MEQETVAAAVGKDPDEEQNAHDSSSTTGKKADEDQQILLAIEDTNWYRSTQALKYLQPVFMPIVRDEMKSLQLQSMNDFGRQLCEEATADDIRPVNGWLAKFKHLCPWTLVACQNLLNIIKGHTSDSVNFYQMLKGTDPQQWLKSPFEFVRLFLKDWMRCDIHDFQECDITALCTIVKRCKPLMQIFDERKIDDLRNVRNRTMHPATMSISQEEMENNIDVILDFLEHIKSLKSTDEVTEAIESIKQLRTGDARLLHSMVVKLIQGWLPGARIAYEQKSDKAKNQLQDIIHMETILATLSSGQQIKQSAGLEFGAKKEENRESENLNELKELKERLQIQQEVIRELEEQNKKLHKEKLKLEKQNEELLRLETMEQWSLSEVCSPKEVFSQRCPDDGIEVEDHPKRTASWGERFATHVVPERTSPVTMDEVSGPGTSSSAKPNNQCAQCAESGKVASATGYCRTCSDYLCASCIEQHKAIRALRDHKLLVGETIAEKKPVEVEKCAVHSDRPIEVYCADDDKFVCSLCSLAHRSCKNVALISKLSSGIESSEEFLAVLKVAAMCKDLENVCKQNIKQHLSTNIECHTKAKEEFKLFREEILSIVDEIGTQVFAKADKLMKENEIHLFGIAGKITAYSEEVEQNIVNIYDKKNNNEREHMFIALKKYGRHVHESAQRLKKLYKDIAIKTFAFHSDTTIRGYLIDNNMLKVED